MTKRRILVLVAPFWDRSQADVEMLRHVKATALVRGWLPVFLPDTLMGALDDHDPKERRIALAVSEDWCRIQARVPGAMMCVVGDRMTEGMKLDVTAWLEAGGPTPSTWENLPAPQADVEEEGDDARNG